MATLVIRNAQLSVFKQSTWRVFEDEMLVHVQEHFPVDFELLGEKQLRQVIQHGIARVEAHDITLKGEACRYINLMFALGGDFDRDPQFPWATASLKPTRGGVGFRVLKTKGGPVEVLALAPEGKELQLVRFVAEPNGANGSAKLAWSAPLPAVPRHVTAALGPTKKGSARHVAFVAPWEKGVELFHSQYSGSAGLRPFQSVKVEASGLLENSAPTLSVDEKGSAWLSVLVVTGQEGRSCSLVEAHFSPEGKPVGGPQVVALGELPARPNGGAIPYADKKGSTERREVVLTLEDGQLLRWGPSGMWVPVAAARSAVRPLVLIPGLEVTYLLHEEPARGLFLEPLF